MNPELLKKAARAYMIGQIHAHLNELENLFRELGSNNSHVMTRLDYLKNVGFVEIAKLEKQNKPPELSC